MIAVFFDPKTLQGEERGFWTEWTAKAGEATERAIEDFEACLGDPTRTFHHDFDAKIWTRLKEWMLENVFHGKCAYCELRIRGFSGDAEHFRPKGSVTRKGDSGRLERSTCVILEGTGAPQNHPGYFWLAYDWRNLVPACENCNSKGKRDRFEVGKAHAVLVKLDQAEVDRMPEADKPRQSRKWPGYYYLSPSQLDAREQPLLLNPLNPSESLNPRNFLRFGDFGSVAAIDGSELGKTTIDILRLASDKLRVARQEAQEQFRNSVGIAWATRGRLKPLIQEYRDGTREFSAAVLDYYRFVMLDEALQEGQPLGLQKKSMNNGSTSTDS
jgi:hypothetical protein